MKPNEQVLVENQDFIKGVALLGLAPQKDSTTVKAVLEAYKPIDDTLEALHGCATCSKPFEASFKVILAYCEAANWFQAESYNPVVTKTEEVKPIKEE